MIDKELYSDVASGRLLRRAKVRRRFGELRHKLMPAVVTGGTEEEDERGAFPKTMHVRETILRLVKLQIPYRGLNYIFGVSHRGTRATDATPPTEEDILRHFRDVAKRGTICLIAGSEWLVAPYEAGPRSYVTLELPEILDRVVGETRVVEVPEGARVRFRFAKRSMRKIARDRCEPGARVPLDVIALARPYDEGVAPTLDVVVAWQPAPGAGAWKPRRGAR
jgi:hypothetical protein